MLDMTYNVSITVEVSMRFALQALLAWSSVCVAAWLRDELDNL